MNKTSLLGFILIAAILFGWMWWMQPSQEELAKQKHIQDSIMMARREAAILDSIRLAVEQAEKEAIPLNEVRSDYLNKPNINKSLSDRFDLVK